LSVLVGFTAGLIVMEQQGHTRPTSRILQVVHKRMAYQLRWGSPVARQRAAATLGQLRFNRTTTRALTEALRSDPAPRVRRTAAVALGRIGRKVRWTSIFAVKRATLEDTEPEVRIAAIRTLHRIGPATVVARTLGQVLARDRDSSVRRTAATVLGTLGARAEAALGPLERALLVESDRRVRRAMLLTLGKIGPRAVASLIRLTRADNSKARWAAAVALGRIGVRARRGARSLLQLLEDSDSNVRWAASWSLGRLRNRNTAPALERVVLRDRRVEVRRAAAVALGRIGPSAGSAVFGLQQAMLKDQSSRVRLAAARSLGRVGSGAVMAIGALQQTLLKDPRDRVRGAAALALGKMGRQASKATRALKYAQWQDDSPRVRRLTMVALKMIQDG
jgi:HEAT repeat protein